MTPERVALTVGTPLYGGQVCEQFARNFATLYRLCLRLRIPLRWLTVVGLPVDQARNAIARQFLASTSTHLLFMDGDQGFRATSVVRMLRAGLDVLGTIIPCRRIDWRSVWQAAQRIGQQHAEHVLPA